MKVIGITGGVGSGKSAVLEYLSTIDSSIVIESDKLAHTLMMPGEAAYKKIVSHFGNQVLDEHLALDRAKLSAIVFSDKEELKALNNIVHPTVKEAILNKIEAARNDGIHYFFIEAALLIEDGYELICDELWFIYVDSETRMNRLYESRGYSREKSLSVMNAQGSDEYFKSHCRYTIDNSGKLDDTISQIMQLLNQ